MGEQSRRFAGAHHLVHGLLPSHFICGQIWTRPRPCRMQKSGSYLGPSAGGTRFLNHVRGAMPQLGGCDGLEAFAFECRLNRLPWLLHLLSSMSSSYASARDGSHRL